MGNTGWRRSKKDDVATEASAPAASKRGVARPRKQRRGDDVADEEEEEEQTTRRAGRRPRPRAARAAGGGGGAATVQAGSGSVVTVRVVMRRKDAEALAARLHARARKARMAELKGELRAGGDVVCGGGGASLAPAACWSPQLAPIKEN
ncbi:unnamed protein product [Urochloa decumbens]|uniref:Uncharacterized protein n=1 Tax=Urochloa decumbens TaxID=240449 RepID=A0ABC8YQL6_9POAL